MHSFFRYAGLICFLFSSLFFQFCNTCGKKSVQQFAIEKYDFQQVAKMDAKSQFYFLKPDSVPMVSNDTVYFLLMPKTKLAQNSLSGNGNLYACDPVMPVTVALGDSMRIETMDNFDATHSAGSDVSDFFLLYEQGFIDSGKMVNNYYPLNAFTRQNQMLSFLHLALIKKPSFKNIRFKIYVYKQKLNDGNTCETPVLSFF